MSTFLVTGGTGTLGRALVPRLAGPGHTVRVLSRQPRPRTAPPGSWATGDLRRGSGVEQAVAGVDVVVHCASAARGDVAATSHLLAAARRARVAHLVYISIVGVDRAPFFYYRAKLECERLVEGSGLPWTVLRATQFHDLVLRTCSAGGWGPALAWVGTSFQPVEVTEVAGRLAGLASGGPAGLAGDFGGPEVRTSASLAEAYLAASGRRRPVLPVWIPGRAGAAFRRGVHLTPGHAAGHRTFEQFLAGRFGAPQARRASEAGNR